MSTVLCFWPVSKTINKLHGAVFICSDHTTFTCKSSICKLHILCSGELMEPLRVSCTYPEDYQTWIFQLQQVRHKTLIFLMHLSDNSGRSPSYWNRWVDIQGRLSICHVWPGTISRTCTVHVLCVLHVWSWCLERLIMYFEIVFVCYTVTSILVNNISFFSLKAWQGHSHHLQPLCSTSYSKEAQKLKRNIRLHVNHAVSDRPITQSLSNSKKKDSWHSGHYCTDVYLFL